jgi:ABC-type ATPase with predicted acetyltransferase domain
LRVVCRHFQATFKSWERLFQDASDFATEVGLENLVSISHSANYSEGIVTVWYWGKPGTCHKCRYDLTGNTSGVCPECGTKLWDK